MSETVIPEGWMREAKIAGSWGLQVRELAEYRKVYLRPEYHWGKFGGLAVYWSPEGIELGRAHFNPPDPEELYRRKVMARQEEYARWAAPPKPGTPLSEHICRVVRHAQNPRMIRVADVNGKVAHIWVRSNIKFREGMLVDLRSCHIMGEEPDGHTMRSTLSNPTRPVLYELMIPLPRYIGRWGYDSSTPGYIGRSGSYFKRGAPEVARTPRSERTAGYWSRVKRAGGGQGG